MGILLDPVNRLISIEIYYIEEVKKHGNSVFTFIRSKDEMDEWKKKGYFIKGEVQQDKSNKIINKLITQWSKPTWKDQNAIVSRSIKTSSSVDGKTINEIDGVKYRDLKLKICLKKWSLTDEEGQPIPVTPEIIDLLDPSVGQELLNNFEKVTEPTQDDLKG